MLYVLTYPKFESDGARVIDQFRTEFEPARAAMVAPHVTLVFGVTLIDADDLIRRTRQVLSKATAFEIVFPGAERHVDRVDHSHKLFLPVSIGRPELVALHQALYDGPHLQELRSDIPYAPHMTIATASDAGRIHEAFIASERLSFPLHAWIAAVDVVMLAANRLNLLAHFSLPAR